MQKILAIYKPKGPTSHDIINQLRKITGIKKIGHAGTLDPLARGVLVVGIGREATRKLNTIVRKEKEYQGIIKLGAESTTDDEEGEKTENTVKNRPSLNQIKAVVQSFQGNISQLPPKYSAIKVKGQKAYQAARRGKEIVLSPRKVEIKEIEVLEYQWPYLKLKVVTGPGTYIRSLARDIGAKLHTGGYLYDLERTRVGEFTKAESISPEEVQNG